MTDGQVNVTFKCPKCEGTVLTLPDNPTDDSEATCKQCGVSFGRWGDIKRRARDAASQSVKDEFRKAFKGIKGFKIK